MLPMQGVKPKLLDAEQIAKAQRMRADKFSYTKIGAVLGVSANTVSRALRQTYHNTPAHTAQQTQSTK